MASCEVYCDICDRLITGRRNRCTVCPDFDLCGPCCLLGYHKDTGHEFEASGPEETISLAELSAHEESLLEAQSALFGNVDESTCTSSTEHPTMRQPLFLCLTCVNTAVHCAAVCLGCSLVCHADHEIVELYTKRNFLCDCGTDAFPSASPCKLNPTRPAARGNQYNQNFQNRFCTCRRPYDAGGGDGDMAQCVVCEDWFHTELRDDQHDDVIGAEAEDHDFVCGGCIARCPFLLDYFGTPAAEAPSTPLAGCQRPRAPLVPLPPPSGPSEASVEPTVPATTTPAPAPASASASAPAATHAGPASSEGTGAAATTETSPALRRRAAYLPRLHTTLCFCPDCLALYATHGVSFLADPSDSLVAYKQRGDAVTAARSEAESTTVQQLFVGLPREGQLRVADRLNQLRSHLDELFASAPEGQELSEQQIRDFFEAKRRRLR